MNEILRRFILEVLICASRAFTNLHLRQEREPDPAESNKDQYKSAKDKTTSKAEH